MCENNCKNNCTCKVKRTSHFWVKVLPKPENLCPNSVYFLKIEGKVIMYVTSQLGVLSLVSNSSEEDLPETNIISPLNTIYIQESEGVFSIDITKTILDAISKPPTYIQPSSSITNVTKTLEVGTGVQVNITQAFQQNDAGILVSQEIKKNGILISNGSSLSEYLVTPVGDTTYSGTVTHLEGSTKLNNLGTLDPTGKVLAGTVTSFARTITGRYKIFHGSAETPVTTSTKVRSLNFNVFDNINNFVISILTTRYVIVTPSTKTLLSVITANNEQLKGNFLMDTFNVEDAAGVNVLYKVYTLETALPLNLTANVTLI